MDISPDSNLITTFRPEDFADYLRLEGWAEAEQRRGSWRVFTNDRVEPDDPVEIVLPRKAASLEGRMHIASSVNLLSQLTDENPETIVQRIQYRNYDVLQITNTDVRDDSSIELGQAAEQVQSMKQLIGYGACSEDTARPYFPRPQGKLFRPVVRHYRFGHTFRGSFGFTLTSRVEQPINYIQTALFPQEETGEEFLFAPAERRVLERIMRGLNITREAVRAAEPERIAREYADGFNGNMCKAIVEMSFDKGAPLEYRVMWSPRIRPAEDVRSIAAVHLRHVEYSSLDTAYMMLRKTEPEYRSVRGIVTGLHSNDNPAGSETRRTVVILWLSKDISGPSKVIVSLENEDYQQALKAHGDWQTVEVTGLLQRFGNFWKLSDPRHFSLKG